MVAQMHLWEGQGEQTAQLASESNRSQWSAQNLTKAMKPFTHYLEKAQVDFEEVGLDMLAPQIPQKPKSKPLEGGAEEHDGTNDGASSEACGRESCDDGATDSGEEPGRVPPCSAGLVRRSAGKPSLHAALSHAGGKSLGRPSSARSRGADTPRSKKSAIGSAKSAGAAGPAMARAQLGGKSKASAGSDETGVQKYLNSLDLAAAMDVGKLGVTKHHAEVLLSKLVPVSGQAPSTD